MFKYCDDCWNEEVVRLATTITGDNVPANAKVTENKEFSLMKDKILLSGEKYGIQLASAAIYYQIVLMIKTRETLAAAYTFLACSFSRIGDIRSELIAENDSPSKAKVMNYTKKVGFLDQLKSHILDYAVMLTDPELAPGFYESLKAYSSIPSSERGSNIPVELILRTYQEESVETFDRTVKLATFFLALGERYKQNGIYERMVAPMLKHLSSSVRSPGRSPIGERGPLDALSIIWSDSIAKLLPRLTYWLPRKNMQLPSEIQKDTFLGPFLSSYNIYPEFGLDLSPVFFPEDYGDSGTGSSSIDMHTEYIGNRKSYDVELSMKYIFNSTESALKALHSCVIGVTRSGDIGKEAVLQYISRAIAFNSSRTKIHTNVEKHCSDGFMHNLSAVCLLLCDPFISGAPHKVHLVDPYYLLLSEKIDGSDYTGIFADNKKRQEYAEKIIEERGLSSYNFVTEIFFLTMVCSHVGMLTIYHNYTSLIKQIESLKERVKRMRDDRDKKKWADSVTFVANNFILKFNERQLEYLTSNRLCVEAMLRNPMVTNLMLKFYNFVLLYIIRCTLVPKKVIEDGFTLRINDNINWEWFFSGDLQGDTVPDMVSYTPGWILEDICDFYTFYLNIYERSMSSRGKLYRLMSFIIIFLKNTHIIKNPYIQARLVEILHALVIPLMKSGMGGMGVTSPNILVSSHSLAGEYLVEVLLNYYVGWYRCPSQNLFANKYPAVEHNSMTNQFYERFKTRFFISQVLRIALNHDNHQRKLFLYTRNVDAFTKFALLLTNDVSYLLDESIGKLKEIQHLEQELSARNSSTYAGGTTASQLDEEKEAQLRILEEQATSYISLGNETLKLFRTLVVDFDIVDQFLTPEICERLAAMLNYNLTALVGPKYTELKVNNPSKYMFEPRKLLEDVITIYLKFIQSDEFVLATSKDCRSYRKETFKRAINILEASKIYPRSVVEAPLMSFIDRVENKIESQNSYYERLGGIPDEFLDPLVYCIMEDPVILPKSRVTVDRSTIRTHLMADEHDPYNRTPLKLSEVIDDTELKKRIQEWLKSKNQDSKSNQS